MEFAVAPVEFDRLSNILDGNLVLTHLAGNHPEKMPRNGMIWFSLQNPPVNLLSRLQPTGLMMLDRDR